MIYLATALYAEAKPLIDHFHLKKSKADTRFQWFTNGELSLILTGSGAISAAVAVSHMLTRCGAGPQDLFVNIGIGGTRHRDWQQGETVLCHKIIDHHTGHAYYPDILIRHDLREGVLETFSRPVQKDQTVQGDVVDMEGYGCCAAASAFFSPHQVYVIKIVADPLAPDTVSPEQVSTLIGSHLPLLESLLEVAGSLVREEKEVLTEEERQLLQQVAQRLRFSVTMGNQLKDLAIQYKIRTGKDLSLLLQDYLSVSVQSKQEGKMCFAYIRQKLLYT